MALVKKPLLDIVTFTRPGKSWRIVNGVLREYDVDEPVLTPEGWSVRPAETNLAWPSEDLQSSRWAKMNASAASATDLIENSSLAAHGALLPVAGQSYTSGKKYTFMADVEPLGAGSKRYLQIILSPNAFGNAADTWAMIDPTDGSVVRKGNALSVQVDPLAGGVFSVNVTATAVATISTYGINLALALTPVRSEVYQGDGASGLKIHRVMLSEGDPKPYIPTTSAAVTRSADNALIQGAAFADVFNPVEGAIVLRYETEFGQDNSPPAFQLRGATPGNTDTLFAFVRPNGGLGLSWYVDSIQTAALTPAATFAEVGTIAFAWDASGMQVFARGSKEGALITPDKYRASEWSRFALGNSGLGGNPNSKSTYHRLTIFTRRPSDAQMEALTS